METSSLFQKDLSAVTRDEGNSRWVFLEEARCFHRSESLLRRDIHELASRFPPKSHQLLVRLISGVIAPDDDAHVVIIPEAVLVSRARETCALAPVSRCYHRQGIGPAERI